MIDHLYFTVALVPPRLTFLLDQLAMVLHIRMLECGMVMVHQLDLMAHMVSFLLMANLVQWGGWVMPTDLSWVDMDLSWVDTAMDLEDLQCRFLAHGLMEH